jgi:hypothetical protein
MVAEGADIVRVRRSIVDVPQVQACKRRSMSRSGQSLYRIRPTIVREQQPIDRDRQSFVRDRQLFVQDLHLIVRVSSPPARAGARGVHMSQPGAGVSIN